MSTINPSELLSEATELERRAALKLKQAASPWCTCRGAAYLKADAAIMRVEAAVKRAKANLLEASQ
ncbi:hypothetical protein [Corallococcus silvisoli]|uniref:hypothetical protein n=1 Tax=Corallococcus silvisoli TaxID=2697031 RepID=UPI0013768B19|nr:hypothetical protein [Corallococcus silvisoli]NBD11861.1 hypothetical protein [Corallococcus silvisoli]